MQKLQKTFTWLLEIGFTFTDALPWDNGHIEFHFVQNFGVNHFLQNVGADHNDPRQMKGRTLHNETTNQWNSLPHDVVETLA